MQEDSGVLDPQVLKTLQTSLPNKDKKYDNTPYDIYEDVYIPEDSYTEDPYTLGDEVFTQEEETFSKDPYEVAEELVDPTLTDDDPYEVALSPTYNQPVEEIDDDTNYSPVSLKEFIEQYTNEKEIDEAEARAPWLLTGSPMLAKVGGVLSKIDWSGAKENSFIRHAYEWLRETADSRANQKNPMNPYASLIPDTGYVSPLSTEGRNLAIGEIDNQLKEIGPVALTNYSGVRHAKDLWQQKHVLQYKNLLDEQAANSEVPSFEELAETIYNDPERFATSMVQELVNKPELLLVPQVAAARAGAAATSAANAVGLGTKSVQVARLAGQGVGAYSGGVTLGTLDRMAENKTKTGDTQFVRALEQSQVDGILGVVTFGGARAFTKSVERVKNKTTSDAKLKTQADRIASSTESNLKVELARQEIEYEVRDPMTETYIDDAGNMYSFEIRETTNSKSLKEQMAELDELAIKFEGDNQALDAINAEIAARQRSLREEQLDAATVKQKTFEIQKLKEDAESRKTRLEIADKVIESSKRSMGETNNFMTVTDVNGVDHTLRRMTPETLDEMILKVPALGDVAYSGKGSYKAMNFFEASIRDFTLGVTAPLERLRTISPSAGKLLDLVDARSGTAGRSYTDTIQEATHYKQGEWGLKSDDIAKTMDDSQKVALRLHMRGVQESTDPIVLKASQEYRKMLNEAAEYIKEAGLESPVTDNFLPRYYNQKLLKESPEAQQALLDAVTSLKRTKGDRVGETIYDPIEVKASIQDIAKNISKESDEISRNLLTGDSSIKGRGRVENEGGIYPIGYRSWDEVPDSLLDQFLDENFIGSIERYLNNTAKRVELDRHFGYNGSKIKDLIKDIANEAETNTQGQRYLNEREAENIQKIYDLLSGKYGATSSSAKSATDAVLSFQTVTKLPLVTVTSMSEPLTMLFRLQEASVAKALAKSFSPAFIRKHWQGVPIEQLRREAKEVGLLHEAALKERLDAMVGEGLEGLPAKITNKYLKAVQLHQWTEHTRLIAYEMSRNDILKMSKGLMNQPSGKRSETRRRALAELGIDPDKAVEWLQKGAEVTDPFYDRIKKGAARHANTIIANPNKINKGTWMSSGNPVARLTSQFKSFGSTFYNDVANTTYDEITKKWNEGNRVGAMKQMSSLFLAVGSMAYWGAYKSDYVYDAVNGKVHEIEDTPEEMALKLIKGATSYIVPTASVWSNSMGSRDPVAQSALGPTGSDLTKVATAVGELDPASLLKTVPIVDKALKSKSSSGPSLR